VKRLGDSAISYSDVSYYYLTGIGYVVDFDIYRSAVFPFVKAQPSVRKGRKAAGLGLIRWPSCRETILSVCPVFLFSDEGVPPPCEKGVMRRALLRGDSGHEVHSSWGR
jgi:hypothetical protein